jgi:hypothetical protein
MSNSVSSLPIFFHSLFRFVRVRSRPFDRHRMAEFLGHGPRVLSHGQLRGGGHNHQGS